MFQLTCSVILVASQMMASPQGSFRVTPEEIANRTTTGITFSGTLSAWSEAQRAEYLKQFEIQAEARRLAPDGIDVESSRIADAAAAGAAATLEFDDVELNRLTIKKALMDHLLLLEQARLLPSLDQNTAENLKADVLHAVDSANTIVKKHLGDILPGELIDRMTQHLGESMVRMIHDPTTYWMKQRPDPEGLQQLLQVFEERLAMSRDRAVTRLDRLDLIDTSARAANTPEVETLRAARRDREMQNIVDEVLSPLRKGLLLATSPPQLLELNKEPDRIVPGYSATVRQWSKRHHEVARQANEQARQERERERRAREARSAATSMAQAALANVLDDVAVESVNAPSKEATPGEHVQEQEPAVPSAQFGEEESPSPEPPREAVSGRAKGVSIAIAAGLGTCAAAVAALYLVHRRT